MKPDDLENELTAVKFRHLTDTELDSYLEQKLDQAGRARAEAHLNLCLLCEKQLMLLKEENQVLENHQVTAEDIAFVRQTMRKAGLVDPAEESTEILIPPGLSFTERLTRYLPQIVTDWQSYFKQVQLVSVRSAGTEIWSWQSEDKVLRIRVVLDDKTDLSIYFTSNDPGFEGTRIRFRLGYLSEEVTMSRSSESEIRAEIIVRKRKRPQDLSDMSIEIIHSV